MGSTGDLVPNFEVKALLNPAKVLDAEGKLSKEVKEAFGVVDPPKKMHIQFLDTPNKDIYSSGWNLRIRYTEGKKKFELTYKKRYTMGDYFQVLTAAQDSMGSATKQASADGFNAASGFDAQVEVGQQGQTLSLSKGEDIKGEGLPGKKDSRKVLAEKAPQLYKDWVAKQKSDPINDAVIYGPVDAKRHEGTWNGYEVDIEVWPIYKSKTDHTLEPIVEASFKANDIAKAVEDRVNLAKFAQDKGWFLPTDSLKTKLIMERYG